MVKPSSRREMALSAVMLSKVHTSHLSIRATCIAFSISETCDRYQPKHSSENDDIADWLIRLTHNQRNWGFGLRFLYLRNVIDDFDREGLWFDVDFSLPSERVIRSLDQIIEWRGVPTAIRCDNGPEYISATTAEWARKRGMRIDCIQSGNPQQNAYVERYHRTVRYDGLAHHLFDSVDETVKVFPAEYTS